MHLDPVHGEGSIFQEAHVEIARIDGHSNNSTQTVVKTLYFSPPDEHERKTFKEKIRVDWDYPGHYHVLNVYSHNGKNLSFTLAASRQTALSQHSVLIAALIMVSVYVFILFEVIHRTLVAIFGSFIALFFLFLIHYGDTESIRVSANFFSLSNSSNINKINKSIL